MSIPRSELFTHNVENQPAAPVPNLWHGDQPLREALGHYDAPLSSVRKFAESLSTPEMLEAGRAANRQPPEIRLFDAGGRRLDEVVFHPAYHLLMKTGLEAGYAAIAWEGEAGGHIAHAAMVYLLSQIEPGVCCPMTMTFAAVPALAADPALEAAWVPKLTKRAYDPSPTPVNLKPAATLGMALTEKQGGSDVRANSTRAEPDGTAYRLTGHKWFCSAPMSDGFLTLAQAPGGLTCFVVPRWLDGERNAIHLMRLKEKLGNRANASSEIEYHGALAHRLGEEGQGVRTIIEMVHNTRLDTAMAPAGLMRAALVRAHHWAAHRTAFQRRLIDHPLMSAVLADLALDAEGALALGLRVAAAFGDAGQRPFARLAVALAKFLSNKRAPNMIYECMEVLGGMGYVEDTGLPLIYREAPLNSIWEGSGNVICLDILRTMDREPDAAAALDDELDAARGNLRCYDDALDEHRARWPRRPEEIEARFFAERAATLLATAALMQSAPEIAESYAAARLGFNRGQIAGSVIGLDAAGILKRVQPCGDNQL